MIACSLGPCLLRRAGSNAFLRRLVSFAAALLVLAAFAGTVRAHAQQVSFPASDGGTVHGTWYRAEQPASALILAFHQGGASGEAEYGPIAPRLNREGYDVLVIDQRAGGGLFDGVNRTVRATRNETDYCKAAADLEGTLAWARVQANGRPLILWGSSYSAALVLRLAATNPEAVIAVLAFSPASGGPMAACRGEEVSDRIQVPVLALRPRSEMELESAIAQAERFRAQGHQLFVADAGTHGSSMLVEERVESPVESTWEAVLAFLRNALDRDVQPTRRRASRTGARLVPLAAERSLLSTMADGTAAYGRSCRRNTTAASAPPASGPTR